MEYVGQQWGFWRGGCGGSQEYRGVLCEDTCYAVEDAASEENLKAVTEEANQALETESEEAASETVIIIHTYVEYKCSIVGLSLLLWFLSLLLLIFCGVIIFY